MPQIRSVAMFTLALGAVLSVAAHAAPAAEKDARAAAPATGTLEGRVVTADGRAVFDARVTLIGANRSANVDRDGRFRFEGLLPGDDVLQTASRSYGTSLTPVTIVAGRTVTRDVVIDMGMHREEITVTWGAKPRSVDEAYQAIDVLTGDDLGGRARASLGTTLDGQLGVSASYHGPGASRPVIRGLGADRVRILEGGVGTGDVSDVSSDHAVAVEPTGAERIEIVRGPATLLYGSSAVGGVVNVIDGRIPDALPHRSASGDVEIEYGANADERRGTAQLTGKLGRVAWQAGGTTRRTHDAEIPRAGDPTGRGRLANSSVSTDRVTAGASWIGRRVTAGAAVTRLDAFYGVPGAALEEEPVRIDAEQTRVDLEAHWTARGGPLRDLTARAVVSDYSHVELEGATPGTVFGNDYIETRIAAHHRPWGGWSGTFGVQWTQRDFSAVGEEAFVPSNTTRTAALFGFEEHRRGARTILAGLRFESRSVRPDGGRSLDFSGISAAAGVRWEAGESFSITTTVSRSVKLPNAEELFADGPHLATFSFERGDPALEEESSLGLDVTLRGRVGRLHADATFYYNDFDDFLFLAPTGEVFSEGESSEDELPVFQYVQRDARFRGFEIHADVDLVHRDPHHFSLDVTADGVDAELSDGTSLPRIPPLRLGAALAYERAGLRIRLGARRVFRQGSVFRDPTSGFAESPTPGYTLVEVGVGYRFVAGGVVHDVALDGSNLTDELARDHVSQIKSLAPLPGRDVRLRYRISF